jgi:hypothetical protein
MSALKARVAINDEDMKNIPNLIKTESRFTNSQIGRLSQEVGLSARQGRSASKGGR